MLGRRTITISEFRIRGTRIPRLDVRGCNKVLVLERCTGVGNFLDIFQCHTRRVTFVVRRADDTFIVLFCLREKGNRGTLGTRQTADENENA
jgi:hypothetical protein